MRSTGEGEEEEMRSTGEEEEEEEMRSMVDRKDVDLYGFSHLRQERERIVKPRGRS